MEKNNSVLNSDKVGRLLLKLTLPAFVGVFVTATYSIVSTIFIGRYVGSEAIAGIAMVYPVQMLSMGIGQLFGSGGASVISRAIGAGNRDRAEHALGNAVSAIIIISLIILILGITHTDFWLRLLGTSENILPYARDYLKIILIGLFFQTFSMSCSTLIMSEGNSRISMAGMMIGALSNVALDALFIVVLKMGVRGAATGTVIAQFLSVLFYMNFYFRGKSFLKIHRKNLLLKWNILKDMLAIGISPFMTSMASSLSMIFINKALLTYSGDLAVSAYAIISRLLMFATLPGLSIGQGSQPILGFNYGSRRFDRLIRTLKIALVSSTSIGLVTFIIVYTFPEVFIGFFTPDDALIKMGVYVARHIFLGVCFTSVIMISMFSFQAMGKAKHTFIIMMRPFIFMLPLILILPRFFALEGVLLTFPLTELLAFILAVALLVPMIRQLKKEKSSQSV